MKRVFYCLSMLILLAACGPKELQPDDAIECAQCDDWNLRLDPSRIYGNTWFVEGSGYEI